MKHTIQVVFAMVVLLPAMLMATEPRLITVAGDADVRVTPDEVVLTLGVETWDQELSLAKAENDQRVEKIIGLVKKYGIAEKHIQTDHLGIEPRYEHNYERKKFIGYFVQRSLVVTLKDINQFEDLLSAVLEAGANYVHGIQFRTTELRKHRDHARSLAIKAAREKAVAMASELGQTIGAPYSIQENPSGWYSGYNSWWGPRRGGGMAQNVIQDMGGGAASGASLAPGQLTVNAHVTVSFELE